MPAPIYPPPTPGTFRTSHSDLEIYLNCGIRWMLRKELKHRRATVPQLIGTAVAGGQKADLRLKQESGTGLKLGEIVDASVAAYETEARESEVVAAAVEVAGGKDDAANAARCYGVEVSPLYDHVTAAEEAIVARFGCEQHGAFFELAGTPDALTPIGIGDTKTGQPWNQAKADRSRQLTGYGWLFRAKERRKPAELWIDSLSRTKKGWCHERIYTRRDDADYEAFLATLRAAKKGIEAGVFLPAPSDSWRCSAKWCEFYGKGCPAVAGR